MIVSHANKYIFLKTRKTAGTSFEIALSKYAGPADILTPISADDEAVRSSLGYRGPQNYMLPSTSGEGEVKAYYNHIPARAVRELLGKVTFDQYLKVSIVRNLFDRAVSGYFWTNRDKPDKISLEHFRKWLLRKKTVNRNRKITHIGGKSTVDFMIRFEFFERDIMAFAERVGLPSTLYQEMRAIGAKNSYRSRAMTTQQLFADFREGRELIEQIFAEEISTYGYVCP